MVRSESTLFLLQNFHAFAVHTEAANDNLQHYLAGVRYRRDTPLVTALFPILIFVKYHNDGRFLLLRHPSFLQIRAKISNSHRRRMRSPLRVILNSSTETPSSRRSFRSPTSRWCLSAITSWAERLAACSPATGQSLRRCLGRASVTWC